MEHITRTFQAPHELVLYSDVDGTLISHTNRLSSAVVDQIKAFIDAGFHFSLATGRSFQGVRRLLTQIPINAPLVLCNGTYVYDPIHNRSWWTVIDKDIVISLLREFYKFTGVYVYLDCADHSAYVSHTSAKQDPFILDEEIVIKHLKAPTDIVHKTNDVLKVGIKMLYSNSIVRHAIVKRVKEIVSEFDGALSCCLSSDTYIEVMPSGVSKWSGIEKAKSMLGGSKKTIYTIGDHYNDLEMIQNSDLGIAMMNAVEEVRSVADHITGHVNDEAITEVLQSIMHDRTTTRTRAV